MQTVGAALDDADLVVQAFDKAKGNFIFRFAVGGDPVPVSLDHGGQVPQTVFFPAARAG